MYLLCWINKEMIALGSLKTYITFTVIVFALSSVLCTFLYLHSGLVSDFWLRCILSPSTAFQGLTLYPYTNENVPSLEWHVSKGTEIFNRQCTLPFSFFCDLFVLQEVHGCAAACRPAWHYIQRVLLGTCFMWQKEFINRFSCS